MTKLLLLDVDTGVDDAWGLFVLLAADPQVAKIMGITCVHGNSKVENVCHNTLYTLATAKRPDIPVYKGASTPLIILDEILTPKDYLHFFGVNGFGDVHLPKIDMPKIQEENAIHALNRITSENKGEITLVCFGPLTNIALAIRTYPEFVDNIKEVMVMGGNYTAVGNMTMTAEFNFHKDPEAANIVLSSIGNKLTLLPWETCLALTIPYAFRTKLGSEGRGMAMDLLNKVEAPVLDRAHRLGFKWWIACDQLLAAIIIDPSVVEETFRVHGLVELAGGLTRGQLVVDHLNLRTQNITIIKRVNQAALQRILTTVINFPE